MPLVDDIDYTIDPPMALTMYTLRGAPLEVQVRKVETSADRVDLFGSMGFDAWTRAVDHGAFHVDLDYEDALGETDREVLVTLLLRVAFAYDYDDPQVLMEELFGESPSVLQQTDAWLLAEATQPVDVPDAPEATASTGFRTRWARPLG